ncbi:MAG: hypothetical protein KC489_14435, partial [Gemmatimonadetes bacterium]|nr:hypothetical protein [Gemmatimonadota bacterium]
MHGALDLLEGQVGIERGGHRLVVLPRAGELVGPTDMLADRGEDRRTPAGIILHDLEGAHRADLRRVGR